MKRTGRGVILALLMVPPSESILIPSLLIAPEIAQVALPRTPRGRVSRMYHANGL
jgi:hypothetical protein